MTSQRRSNPRPESHKDTLNKTNHNAVHITNVTGYTSLKNENSNDELNIKVQRETVKFDKDIP